MKKVNIYTCASESCAKETKTVYRDVGTTPFVVTCIHCGKTAKSGHYKCDQEESNPDLIWIKPKNSKEWSIYMDSLFTHDSTKHIKQHLKNKMKRSIQMQSMQFVQEGGVVCVPADKIKL